MIEIFHNIFYITLQKKGKQSIDHDIVKNMTSLKARSFFLAYVMKYAEHYRVRIKVRNRYIDKT